MPLPSGATQWPPKAYDDFFLKQRQWNALYVGDTGFLQGAFSQSIARPSQYAGGLVGAAARTIWGKPSSPSAASYRVHSPVPADIATLSADLLFSEPPRVVMPNAKSSGDGLLQRRTALQDQIERMISTPRFHSTLLEAAEAQAALGGVYLRLVWDASFTGEVMADVVHADAAIPEFRFGRLAAVTFWDEVADEKSDVIWRHLERHEHGRILHGLYMGSWGQLGVRVAVDAHPTTEWLTNLVDAEGAIPTGLSDRLTVAYIPNRLPNPYFRRIPLLADMGASDYQGIEETFDRIDMVWSSWMRDIRLAKARLIAPAEYLRSNGPGKGASFDFDQEVYEGMATLTGPDGKPMGIQAEQFAIRNTEHEATIRALMREAFMGAGYSESSLGDEAAAMRTATEVKSDDRLSNRTRDKKTNYWRNLDEFALTWLLMQSQIFGGPIPNEKPELRFAPESQFDIEAAARTIQMIAAANAASTETIVRMLHPEWEGDTVNAEVAKIQQEKNQPVVDPSTFTGFDDLKPEARDEQPVDA